MAAVSPFPASGSTRVTAPAASHRAIAAWLLVCCALVFAIIVVGGVTRLTHSGLSITEWQPIVGTLPPLSDGDWQVAFPPLPRQVSYLKVRSGRTGFRRNRARRECAS